MNKIRNLYEKMNELKDYANKALTKVSKHKDILTTNENIAIEPYDKTQQPDDDRQEVSE